MYLISNNSKLEYIALRGYFISKKNLKKNNYQCLVYLRSPKHFNIGKQKVFSFNSKFFYKFTVQKKIYYNKTITNNEFNYPIFLKNFKPNVNFKHTSTKVTVTSHIKWV